MPESKDFSIFLFHILDEINYIKSFIEAITFSNFKEDKKTSNATIRSLEVIGEAIKNIPKITKHKYPKIAWKGFTSLF